MGAAAARVGRGEMKCTWLDCKNEATHPHKATDGSIWANLCDAHHARQEAAEKGDGTENILSCWVKAQGGAKRAAARMMGDRI